MSRVASVATRAQSRQSYGGCFNMLRIKNSSSMRCDERPRSQARMTGRARWPLSTASNYLKLAAEMKKPTFVDRARTYPATKNAASYSFNGIRR